MFPIIAPQYDSVIEKPSYLEREFEVRTFDASSHVFEGEVINVESKRHEDEGNGIYTFATIKLDRYDKGKGANEVIVIYKGGVVGDIGKTVIYLPHGTVFLKTGQKVIVFANKIEGKENHFSTYYVKNIEQSKIDESKITQFTATYNVGKPGSIFKVEFTELESVYEYMDEGFQFFDNLHWDTDEFPIPYWINVYGTTDCIGENAAVQAGFQTWQDVSGTELEFDHAGNTYRNADIENNDTYNDVDWVDLPLETWQAWTHYFYWAETGEIWEVDTFFNDHFDWCIGANEGEYDVQSIATHEVGHWLSLNHLFSPSNDEMTMYYDPDDNDTSWRSLEWGDEAGVVYIYPD